MCGIVGGVVAQREVGQLLIEGLKHLEYRGYDSAGLVLLSPGRALERLRVSGKVSQLQTAFADSPCHGNIGLAHTRWATHGAPTESNAHPHISRDQIAIVHNGIIENHEQLRERLASLGYTFNSETDTELVAHLIHYHLQETNNLLRAVHRARTELEGSYALGVMAASSPDRLVAVRSGSPLVIGLGIGANFMASDPLALQAYADQFIYLEEGDIAEIMQDRYRIYDGALQQAHRVVSASIMRYSQTDRGSFRHFMLKEIYEQPQAIRDLLEGRLYQNQVVLTSFGEKAKHILPQIERVQIVACGTSFHAGMVARNWLEGLAGIHCNVEVASEFRYRSKVVEPNTLFVAISQSGETADTLAALYKAKMEGHLATLAICNVPHSSLVREADLVFMTCAGVEVGVASTKAFTTQLASLLLLTLALGRNRTKLTPAREVEIVQQLQALPLQIEQTLKMSVLIERLAERFADKKHTLFLGRGVQYPIALEGALKLKEISYIHAEAYPAGELKHGPLALVDENMPVVAVAPNDDVIEKIKSNLQEVRARGGELYVFTDSSHKITPTAGIQVFEVPVVGSSVVPIIYTIPLQLLAYYVAVIKGTDVDQPRNLAKSVTVE